MMTNKDKAPKEAIREKMLKRFKPLKPRVQVDVSSMAKKQANVEKAAKS